MRHTTNHNTTCGCRNTTALQPSGTFPPLAVGLSHRGSRTTAGRSHRFPSGMAFVVFVTSGGLCRLRFVSSSCRRLKTRTPFHSRREPQPFCFVSHKRTNMTQPQIPSLPPASAGMTWLLHQTPTHKKSGGRAPKARLRNNHNDMQDTVPPLSRPCTIRENCKWQIKNQQFFVINFHQFFVISFHQFWIVLRKSAVEAEAA